MKRLRRFLLGLTLIGLLAACSDATQLPTVPDPPTGAGDTNCGHLGSGGC